MSVPFIPPAELAQLTGDFFALSTPPRGLVVHYDGASTRCPCCSRSNWLVGRRQAECAFCAMALPLAPARAE